MRGSIDVLFGALSAIVTSIRPTANLKLKSLLSTSSWSSTRPAHPLPQIHGRSRGFESSISPIFIAFSRCDNLFKVDSLTVVFNEVGITRRVFKWRRLYRYPGFLQDMSRDLCYNEVLSDCCFDIKIQFQCQGHPHDCARMKGVILNWRGGLALAADCERLEQK